MSWPRQLHGKYVLSSVGTSPSSQVATSLYIIRNIWLTGLTGKILNNLCQGAITALTANPDTGVSTQAPALIVLVIAEFLINMVEVIAEIYMPRDRVAEQAIE